MSKTAGEEGITLLETVCILAILAILVAVILPAMPHTTTRAGLEAYSMAAASVLKADRNAAIRRGTVVATNLSLTGGTIRSGANGRVVKLPGDVTFHAVLADQCGGQAVGTVILFFPSGMSCGGTIILTRPGVGYEIRVGWLTGGVEIVPANVL